MCHLTKKNERTKIKCSASLAILFIFAIRNKFESFVMKKQDVIISRNLEQSLEEAIARCPHDRLFILTDETTQTQCWPVISNFTCLQEAQHITIRPTDDHKDLESLAHVWSELGRLGGTRHSLLINLGGGMVTDLGGFAASTFKRGIAYINIPTTLLAMVDASVGGKTGINFNGLKNEVGVFNPASTVILDTEFLKTLDRANLCSGYAEMLKHGLISNEENWNELLRFDLDNVDYKKLQDMVATSVAIKERVVEEDPFEQGHPQGPESGTHRRPCSGESGHERRTHRAARLCRGLGTGLRTVSEHTQGRFPEREDASGHLLYQGVLRYIPFYLQGI